MLDAIQGLGVFPLDVRETDIDFMSADGHKWMLGPEGAGLFYIRNSLIEQLSPRNVGWRSVPSISSPGVSDPAKPSSRSANSDLPAPDAPTSRTRSPSRKEKSLGAIQKAGRAPVDDILSYADRIRRPGLSLSVVVLWMAV